MGEGFWILRFRGNDGGGIGFVEGRLVWGEGFEILRFAQNDMGERGWLPITVLVIGVGRGARPCAPTVQERSRDGNAGSGEDVDSRSFGYAQDRFRGNDGAGWGFSPRRHGERGGLGGRRRGDGQECPSRPRLCPCMRGFWIPAFAGMTGWGRRCWFQARMWIPACAGMTVGVLVSWREGWFGGKDLRFFALLRMTWGRGEVCRLPCW